MKTSLRRRQPEAFQQEPGPVACLPAQVVQNTGPSPVSTCEPNGVNPKEYLADVLLRVRNVTTPHQSQTCCRTTGSPSPPPPSDQLSVITKTPPPAKTP